MSSDISEYLRTLADLPVPSALDDEADSESVEAMAERMGGVAVDAETLEPIEPDEARQPEGISETGIEPTDAPATPDGPQAESESEDSPEAQDDSYRPPDQPMKLREDAPDAPTPPVPEPQTTDTPDLIAEEAAATAAQTNEPTAEDAPPEDSAPPEPEAEPPQEPEAPAAQPEESPAEPVVEDATAPEVQAEDYSTQPESETPQDPELPPEQPATEVDPEGV